MPLLIIGGLLILYGIFAIFSVSINESFQLTLKMSEVDPYNYFYFFKQLKSLLIALFFSFIAYKIPLSFIQKNKNWIFLSTLILQLLVVFTPLGITLNGAKGWMYIQGFGTIQPSEFFKLGFVIFMAGWFIKKKKILTSIKGFLGFIVVISMFFFVFFLIPDLGTLLILGPVMLIMYRYVGGKISYILFLTFSGLFIGVTIGMQFSYIKDRFAFFLNSDADETGRGIGWQVNQGLIAIGGGGMFGQGYGKGLQKFGYIPEAQSDFIFAAFSEEVGLLGNSILLTLYFFLFYYFLKKLKNIKDEYSKVLGVGIISLIVVQIFINIGGNTKILPLTGLTLPFISFGGTSLMITMVELVLLYKIITENKN